MRRRRRRDKFRNLWLSMVMVSTRMRRLAALLVVIVLLCGAVAEALMGKRAREESALVVERSLVETTVSNSAAARLTP